MNNDFKLTISRSFERTIQIVQFEPAKFWASYSLEVPADTKATEAVEISETLFERAKTDVEKAMADYKEEKIKAETVKRIDQGGWPKEE